MRTKFPILTAGFALTASLAFGQAINVTTTGVDIGATTATTPGSLFQQSGQTTTFWTQDGVGQPSLRMTIQGDGKVGIGTSTPGEKLEVSGNTTISGTATVGSLTVGSSPIFSVGSFESAEQEIPGSLNTITLAHGLGGIPKYTTVSLRCKIPQYGWEEGDEILLSSISLISNNHGITTAVNATDIKLAQYGSIYIHKFSPPAPFIITAANWRLVFRAWR